MEKEPSFELESGVETNPAQMLPEGEQPLELPDGALKAQGDWARGEQARLAEKVEDSFPESLLENGDLPEVIDRALEEAETQGGE